MWWFQAWLGSFYNKLFCDAKNQTLLTIFSKLTSPSKYVLLPSWVNVKSTMESWWINLVSSISLQNSAINKGKVNKCVCGTLCPQPIVAYLTFDPDTRYWALESIMSWFYVGKKGGSLFIIFFILVRDKAIVAHQVLAIVSVHTTSKLWLVVWLKKPSTLWITNRGVPLIFWMKKKKPTSKSLHGLW